MPETANDDEIDLRIVWQTIWANKLLIAAFTIVFAVGSTLISTLIPNKYTSEMVLIPSLDEQNAPLIGGRLGGLASLAGFGGRGGVVDNVTIAQEIIKSRAFTTGFVRQHHLEVPLMAAKGWDIKEKQWIIDDKKYDSAAQKWVRKVKPPRKPEPSDQELYKAFSKRLNISSDKLTGIIRISFTSLSPEAAQQWLNMLLEDINNHMRQRDIREARRSIKYLQRQLEKTSVKNMEQVFYQLIEQQTKTMMLAEARAEYTFKVIDPAVVPEEKSGPKRSLIVIGAMLGGAFFGMLAAFALSAFRESKSKAGHRLNSDVDQLI